MANEKRKLTPKQRAFADEYIANKGNATQAAIKAGYSEKTSAEIGRENLRKPHIRDYIADNTEEVLKRRKVSADDVIEELVSIAKREQQTSYSKQYDHLEGAVIKEVTYTFQPSVEESTRALELLMKYLGLDDKNNDLRRERAKLEIRRLEQEVDPSPGQEERLAKRMSLLMDAVEGESND